VQQRRHLSHHLFELVAHLDNIGHNTACADRPLALPVNATALIDVSTLQQLTMSWNSLVSWKLMALKASGRLNVIHATLSHTSNFMNLKAMPVTLLVGVVRCQSRRESEAAIANTATSSTLSLSADATFET
jgi:hypothetical protein